MLSEEYKEKLSKISLLVMDVDGTLTDGSMYYTENGDTMKKFNVRDGMGIILLQKAGIKTAFLTSEQSMITKKRAEKLEIDYIFLGSRNKTADLTSLAKLANISFENIAYIGDDINDLPCMSMVGFSACPLDSHDIIKNSAHYICQHIGGAGAIRELCELMLISKNAPITLTEQW